MTEKQTLGRETVSKGLLSALMEDEVSLQKADETLRAARSQYDVASRRFAAMREAVRERLGVSPYSKNVQWPLRYNAKGRYVHYSEGHYRYVRMKVGDALAEALEESEEPLDLAGIVEVLNQGGLYVRDTRVVNAGLINTKGVKKLDDGRYTYEKEEEEDLPW